MEIPRTADEIAKGLSTRAGDIGAAILALPPQERATLAQAVLPTHEELDAFIDDISDPTSPSYDPDLAN